MAKIPGKMIRDNSVDVNHLSTGLVEYIAENGDKYYEFNQVTASLVWSVTHNLNKYPTVTVLVNGSDLVIPDDIIYVDANSLEIHMTALASGIALLQ